MLHSIHLRGSHLNLQFCGNMTLSNPYSIRYFKTRHWSYVHKCFICLLCILDLRRIAKKNWDYLFVVLEFKWVWKIPNSKCLKLQSWTSLDFLLQSGNFLETVAEDSTKILLIILLFHSNFLIVLFLCCRQTNLCKSEKNLMTSFSPKSTSIFFRFLFHFYVHTVMDKSCFTSLLVVST